MPWVFSYVCGEDSRPSKTEWPGRDKDSVSKWAKSSAYQQTFPDSPNKAVKLTEFRGVSQSPLLDRSQTTSGPISELKVLFGSKLLLIFLSTGDVRYVWQSIGF